MRKKASTPRTIRPDRKHNSVLLAKFINNVMKGGKKTVAEHVIYDTLQRIEKETKTPGLAVFEKAVDNVSPNVEIKSRRIGGATYQVPREVRGERKTTLAFRWILQAARSGKGKPIAQKLAAELIAASNNEGAAIKKKSDTHRMAEANRAFAHFSW